MRDKCSFDNLKKAVFLLSSLGLENSKH